MKKGISLAINVLILLSLAIAVLFFTLTYFNRQKESPNKIETQAKLIECCQKWISYDSCGTSVGPGGSTLEGCENFVELAKEYGLTDSDGNFDEERLKEFCGCSGY